MAVEVRAGVRSCKRLAESLQSEFGSLLWIDDISDADAFGWRLSSRPTLLFSISTAGGALPEGVFDLQVSIADDSLKNGEIIFGPEWSVLTIQEVCSVVRSFHRGELA